MNGNKNKIFIIISSLFARYQIIIYITQNSLYKYYNILIHDQGRISIIQWAALFGLDLYRARILFLSGCIEPVNLPC